MSEPFSVQLARLHAQSDDTTQPPVDDSSLAEASSSSAPAAPAPTTNSGPRRQPLDLSSESAFPSLGASSTPRVAPSWGNGAASRLKEPPTAPIATFATNDGYPASSATQAAKFATSDGYPASPAAQAAKNGMVTEVFDLPQDQQVARTLGAKGTTAETVKSVKYRTNTDINLSTSRNGTTNFLVKGKVEDVARAKRELLAALAIKIVIEHSIPSSVRRFIIGPKGATLKGIESKSGARIQMPPRPAEFATTEVEPAGEDDDDEKEEEMVKVTITGDSEGVKIAQAEIDKIVNEKTSKRTIRLKQIDPQFYPFLAGAHDRAISKLADETGTRIRIPQLGAMFETYDGAPITPEKRDSAIIISGEREGVQRAREQIEEQYKEMQKTTRTLSLVIPKRQHKYLDGANMMEVFEATGCTVELPSDTDPSESVTIRGPESQFIDALRIVMEKANSMQIEILDLATVHTSAADKQTHARNVLKYLINRGKHRKLEVDTGATVGIPREAQLEKGVVLEFASKNAKEAEEARKQAFDLVKTLRPSLFGIASVEPHLHRHVIGRKGQNITRIKEQYGVDIIVPDEKDESADILIVYEGKEGEPEIKDKKKREANVKETLESVRGELVKLGQDASDFTTQTLTIPVKFHRTIIGPKGNTLNSIVGGPEAPVSVKFGSSRTGAAERSATAEGRKEMEVSEDTVLIRGPTEEVNRVAAEIQKIYEETRENEIMNSYVLEFTVPVAYSSHVIGKGGANINKLKEQLGVRIDIDGGRADEGASEKPAAKKGDSVKVSIQGTQKNVEAAKERILGLVSNLADQTTLNLHIPAQYHRSLIGLKGKYVKRLEETYGVFIKFPRDNKDGEGEGEGEAVVEKEKQKPDEVVLRGGKKGVEGAKSELLELLEWEKEHGNVVTFTFAAQHLPHVVGKSGAKVNEIKDETETRIDFSEPYSDPANPSDRIVTATIQGTKKNIAEAKKSILAIVSDFENQVSFTVKIDPAYHKFLIGQGGSRIRDLVVKCGGPSDRQASARMVNFPRPGATQPLDEVVLKGDRVVVEKIKAELEREVAEQNSRTTITVFIEPSEHASVIGRSGANLKDLQARYNVDIQFPNARGHRGEHTGVRTPGGSWSDDVEEDATNGLVTIAGLKENAEKARDEMLAKIRSTRSIQIPRQYHRSIIGTNGATYRKLRNELSVIVDHGGEPEPKAKQKPKSQATAPQVNGGGARIDDDVEKEEATASEPDLPFEIVENHDAEETGDITWNFKGEKNNIEKAEKIVLDRLEEIKRHTHTHTGYLTVPQQLHRHVIGRAGSTISRIRDQSGCLIDVPRKGDEIIVLNGTKENLEEAKRLITDALARSNTGRA